MACRERDGKRFLLKRWQYEIIGKMDGRRTFGELAQETQLQFPGRFSADGLLNFYSWLYNENLVIVTSASIFEFDVEEEEVIEQMDPSSWFVSPSALASFSPPEAAAILLAPGSGEDSRRKSCLNRRAILQLAALLIFSLCLLRIGLVMAPVFTPVATRLVAMWKGVEMTPRESVVAEAERVLPTTHIAERGLASKAAKIPLAQAATAGQTEVAKPMASSPVSSIPVPVTESMTDQGRGRLDSLRKELAACRIRRDEFYIQEDVAGYRREVERMTAIVREIGDIETGH